MLRAFVTRTSMSTVRPTAASSSCAAVTLPFRAHTAARLHASVAASWSSWGCAAVLI